MKNDLMNLDDMQLHAEYLKRKDDLFDLFDKLDITNLRLGIMSIGFNKLLDKDTCIDLDDLLHLIRSKKSAFYEILIERDRRNKNA